MTGSQVLLHLWVGRFGARIGSAMWIRLATNAELGDTQHGDLAGALARAVRFQETPFFETLYVWSDYASSPEIEERL